ncbi:MAG: hypothetical protein MUC83_18410 [Pirellula sp.]|nr:hypothetical protein [Pirellula sp.]
MDLATNSTKLSGWQSWVSLVNACIVAVLLASGLFHMLLAGIDGTPWNDPTSFRKPALFGISTGLTLWSCDWCFRQFRESPWSEIMRSTLGVALLFEVGLISLQTWRGEASHFNRSGVLNAFIESGMLFFIVVAMAIILILAMRSSFGDFLPQVSSSMRIAIWWGLQYLLISGLIGFVITFIGHAQQLTGKAPELWGERGVLKFPHGAALHAIQTLAVVAWIADRMGKKISVAVVRSVAYLHGTLLLLAIHHTVQGRGRFEFDLGSWIISAIGLGCCLIPFAISGDKR